MVLWSVLTACNFCTWTVRSILWQIKSIFIVLIIPAPVCSSAIIQSTNWYQKDASRKYSTFCIVFGSSYSPESVSSTRRHTRQAATTSPRFLIFHSPLTSCAYSFWLSPRSRKSEPTVPVSGVKSWKCSKDMTSEYTHTHTHTHMTDTSSDL